MATTSVRIRRAVAFILPLVAAACAGERMESGRPPEGDLRPAEDPNAKARREQLRAQRLEEEELAATPGTPGVAKREVVGVASTKLYHRPSCSILARAPKTEHVPFASAWEAIEAGQSPCGDCRPGP